MFKSYLYIITYDARLLHINIELFIEFFTMDFLIFKFCNNAFFYLFCYILGNSLSNHITVVILQREHRIDILVKEVFRCFFMKIYKDLKQVLPHLKTLVFVEFKAYDRSHRIHLFRVQHLKQGFFYLRDIDFCFAQVIVNVYLSVHIDLLGIKFREKLKLGDLDHTQSTQDNKCNYDHKRTFFM